MVFEFYRAPAFVAIFVPLILNVYRRCFKSLQKLYVLLKLACHLTSVGSDI